MSEMVERVATALACSMLTGLRSDWPNMWAGLDDYEREGYRINARAAIKAMREPTLEMHNVGFDESTAGYAEEIIKIWHAMIDEALGAA